MINNTVSIAVTDLADTCNSEGTFTCATILSDRDGVSDFVSATWRGNGDSCKLAVCVGINCSGSIAAKINSDAGCILAIEFDCRSQGISGGDASSQLRSVAVKLDLIRTEAGDGAFPGND